MYIDRSIYCKENLKKEDLDRLTFIRDLCFDAVYSTLFDCDQMTDIPFVDNMIKDISNNVCDNIRRNILDNLDDAVVSIIDSYECDVECVEGGYSFAEDFGNIS